METARGHAGLVAVLLAAALSGCHRRRPPPVPAPPPSIHLSGRVVDAGGHGVPDARVLAFPLQGVPPPALAVSDVDGRFDLSTGAGTYRVLVEATGFPLASRPSVTAPAAGLTLALAGEGHAIAGTVTRAGTPVEQATVRLADEAGGPARETRTGPDGRFAMSGLGEGTYALRAESGGFASATARGVTGSGPAPALQLAEATTLVGRVTEDGARPAAGVAVRADDQALPAGEDPLATLARTDGSGAFRLGPLPPGRYRITAAQVGLILRRPVSIDVHPPAVPQAITLDLLHGARLSGRVAGPGGAPIAGARVRLSGAGVDELAVRPGTLPLAAVAAALPPGVTDTMGASQMALTDRGGAFALDRLPPGIYRVDVTHDGFQPLGTEVSLRPGERHDLGSLSLAAGFPVRGRVLDETGAPIEGARVSVTGGPGVVTDAAGQFALSLAAGRYHLVAAADGRGSAAADATAEAGGAAPLVELRLSRAEASLEGLVRDAAGRPLARARLAARRAAADAPSDPPLATATTDAGGHFRMARLPAGELRIEVQHPDYPRVSVPATAGQFAAIAVPVPGGVIGEVRGSATGALVPRARIEATGPDGATAVADTKGTGTFRLLHLAPGSWRIRASAPRMRAAEQEVDVPASATLGEPSVRDIRIDLDPA